jgi:CheY-like chemotaxis protein
MLEAPQTVLLADDEDLVRTFVRTVLERSGYCVLEAPGGSEALELCQRHEGPIHLLVTDLVMPRMNGRELAERVRKLRPGTKVLYVSGYPRDEVNRAGFSVEGTGLLRKPFRLAELKRKIEELLT